MRKFDVRVNDVFVGFGAAVQQVSVSISLAVLIFSGPVAAGAGRATALFIAGTVVLAIVVGWRTSLPVAIGGAQDSSGVLIAAAAASLVAANDLSPEVAVPTVVVMIGLCTMVTAVVFLVVARRRWTRLVQYLPRPVVTGFMAGTGWILVRGGLEVMWDRPLSVDAFGQWSAAQLLLPGVGLALAMVIILSTRLSNTLVSAGIVAAIALFHLVGAMVSSRGELQRNGWLVGPFPDDLERRPLTPADLADADWGVLLDQALPILAVALVATTGLLLNLSGLQAIQRRDVELDSEFASCGFANAVVAPIGGLVGYHHLGSSALAHRLGARGRTVPMVIAIVGVGVLITGPGVVALMPRAVAGGVLVGLGLNLLVEWVRETLPALRPPDRLISGGMVIVIAILGILPGVALGLVAATFVFLHAYSGIDPVRYVLPAAGLSNVERSPHERAFLTARRSAVVALPLQGFLFFGSVSRLRSTIADVTDGPESVGSDAEDTPGTRFVILDFDRVSGVDSTAAADLAEIIATLRDRGIDTLLSGADGDVDDMLVRRGAAGVGAFDDLDHAIAEAEERLLVGIGAEDEVGSLFGRLGDRVARRRLEPGEVLIEADDGDRSLYFVEQGRLTVWAALSDGRRARVRQVMAGAALGEISFFTGEPRTADVIADSEVVVAVLTREEFDLLCSTEPEAAIEIQQILSRQLAERLSSTSSMVRTLLR